MERADQSARCPWRHRTRCPSPAWVQARLAVPRASDPRPHSARPWGFRACARPLSAQWGWAGEGCPQESLKLASHGATVLLRFTFVALCVNGCCYGDKGIETSLHRPCGHSSGPCLHPALLLFPLRSLKGPLQAVATPPARLQKVWEPPEKSYLESLPTVDALSNCYIHSRRAWIMLPRATLEAIDRQRPGRTAKRDSSLSARKPTTFRVRSHRPPAAG